jgi:poly-beta-hydroxybutyrate-responsive repressor
VKNTAEGREGLPSSGEPPDHNQSKAAEAGLPPRGTPKNYLMAWLLVMLKDLNLHGYEIMKELKENFAVVSDPGTIYRALRQLERDGYIASWWDPKEQGPARRIYTLTNAGSDALKLWSSALEQYRSNLDAFFSLYTGTWSKDRFRHTDEEHTTDEKHERR